MTKVSYIIIGASSYIFHLLTCFTSQLKILYCLLSTKRIIKLPPYIKDPSELALICSLSSFPITSSLCLSQSPMFQLYISCCFHITLCLYAFVHAVPSVGKVHSLHWHEDNSFIFKAHLKYYLICESSLPYLPFA